jgi:hypothetical protein
MAAGSAAGARRRVPDRGAASERDGRVRTSSKELPRPQRLTFPVPDSFKNGRGDPDRGVGALRCHDACSARRQAAREAGSPHVLEGPGPLAETRAEPAPT